MLAGCSEVYRLRGHLIPLVHWKGLAESSYRVEGHWEFLAVAVTMLVYSDSRLRWMPNTLNYDATAAGIVYIPEVFLYFGILVSFG